MANMNKVAVAYVRMSSDIQLKGHSLDRQDNLASEYAESRNITITETLYDIGKSGFSGDHIKTGDFGRYLRRIESGDIDPNSLLLVESVDRLSRQEPRKAFSQFNKIIDYGIEIHTLFDRQIYSTKSVDGNQGQMFQLLGYMLRAHSESKEKSRRLKSRWASNRESISQGKILTTVCPAWLVAKPDKTGFNKVDDRVSTVKKIFDLCITDNMGVAQITSYLNTHEDKYPRFTAPHKANRLKNGRTRTGWQKSYVTKILNNASVYGEFQQHRKNEDGIRIKVDEPINNYFPLVISKNRFIEAQAVIRVRKVGGGGRKGAFRNVFTKLAICGNCRAPIHYVNKGNTPKGGQYLRCSNSLSKHGTCTSRNYKYDEFENDFLTYITEVDLKPILAKSDDKTKRQKLLSKQKIIIEKIDQKKIQLENLTKVFDSLLDDFAIENLTKNFQSASSELSKLQDDDNDVNIELAKLKQRTSDKTQIKLRESIKQLSEEATEEQKIDIRRRMNKQIGEIIQYVTIYNVTGSFVGKEFNSEFDERSFNKLERYFTVRFKNNEVKRVHPSVDTAWMKKDEQSDKLNKEAKDQNV